EAGLDATFMEADAQHLPDELRGSFDCVFASYGVLMWIADLDAWMRSASSALREGGRLVVLEGHPVSLLVKSIEPPVLDGPYAGGASVQREGGDYARPTAKTEHNTSLHYRWGIGDVVTSAIQAGLRIEAVTEWIVEESHPAPH